jgi:hypothetical protein
VTALDAPESMRPKLFVGGAATPGTTLPRDQLAAHPDVFMPSRGLAAS